MRRLAVTVLIALSYVWFGACRSCMAQQIIGRPMFPLNAAIDPAATSLTNGLVNFWRMDEASGTRNDSVGSINLTDVNTVTSTTGISTNAAQFTHANAEDLTATSIPGTGQTYSFAFWFKLNSLPASEYYALNVATSGTVGNICGVTFYSADSKIRWWVHNGGVPGTFYFNTNTTVLSTATWYFMYATRDHVGGSTYTSINGGSLVSGADDPGNESPAAPSAFAIGGYTQAGGLTWDGLIDEVGCWSRTLTTLEIAYLYHSGLGRGYTPNVAIPFH